MQKYIGPANLFLLAFHKKLNVEAFLKVPVNNLHCTGFKVTETKKLNIAFYANLPCKIVLFYNLGIKSSVCLKRKSYFCKPIIQPLSTS